MGERGESGKEDQTGQQSVYTNACLHQLFLRDVVSMRGERDAHSSTRSHSCLIQGFDERA